MEKIGTVEAAAMLGVSTSHVRRLGLLGILHSERPSPRVLLFDRCEVERYREHRRKPGRPRKQGAPE